MSKPADIKTAIKAKLDTLLGSGLGEVIVDDFKVDPLQRDAGTYPLAVVGTPAITSLAETNRDNMRTYTYVITVVMKGENIATDHDVEDLLESIIDLFDNDPTLGGNCEGAVDPAGSDPQAYTTPDRTWIWFEVTLRCKALKVLTY